MNSGETSSWNASRQSAFTRIDLVVTVLTLAFLAIMILPALARTRVKPQGMQCLYNLRQIILAWQMYADDSNGKFAPNHGSFPPNPDYDTPPAGITFAGRWVGGDMRGGQISGQPMLDAFNSPLLVNPIYSVMGPYIKDPRVFRCPSDQSTWTDPRFGMEEPRVRSYSMNQGVGCAFNGTRQDPGHAELGHWLTGGNSSPAPFRTYIENNDLYGTLSPAGLFVLVEEHPNSINDGAFAVHMPASPSDSTGWIDVPGNIHSGNSCSFAFADGHAESHRWAEPAAIPPVIWSADQTAGLGNGGAPPGPANPDIKWLAHHASCLPVGVTGFYYPP